MLRIAQSHCHDAEISKTETKLTAEKQILGQIEASEKKQKKLENQ